MKSKISDVVRVIVTRFFDCAIVKNELYFYSGTFKALLKMNLQTKKVAFVSELYAEGQKLSGVNTIIADGSQLYLFSSDGKYGVSYSLRTGKYNICDIGCNQEQTGCYVTIGQNSDSVIIVPKNKNKIIKINKKTGKLTNCEFPWCSDEKNETPLFRGDCQGETMWLFPDKVGEVLRYSIGTGECEHYALIGLTQVCKSIVGFKDRYYLLGREGRIFAWNKEDAVEEVADLCCASDEYQMIVAAGSFLYVLPEKGKKIVRLEGTEICSVPYPDGFAYMYENSTKFLHYAEDEHGIYFAQPYGNYNLFLDKKTGEPQWYIMKMPIEYIAPEYGFVFESEQTTLSEYLRYVR